jgi:hypothetical protein
MKYLILFFTYFISIQIFSQVDNSISVFDTTLTFTLNKNIDPLVVHFEITDSNDITIYETKIYGNNKVLIQSINDTINFMGKEHRMMVDQYSDEPTSHNFNNDISFIDINFDGYTDIKIKSLVTVHGSSAFNYFLYNQDSNNFIYNQYFSELDGDLSLNNELKEIYTSDYTWQDETWTKWTYKVLNNKPILYTIKTEHVYTEDNKQKFHTVIEQLINGEMKVITDTVEWKGK